MKKSKILSLILCAVLIIAFASLDVNAATQAKVTPVEFSGDVVAGLLRNNVWVETCTIVTPDATEEKQVDDFYYEVNSGEPNVVECKPNGKIVGDTFISFDFKLFNDAYFYIYTVPYKSEGGITYKQMNLVKVSLNGGVQETNAASILGTTNTGSPETFVTPDKIKQGKWNSLQIEVCAGTGSVNIWLNGEKYEIPTQESITIDSVECGLKHGFNAVRLDCANVSDNELFLDNIYIQCGEEGAVSPYEDAFRETNTETGYHNGHLGVVAEHSIATFPTVTSAYDLDARNGKLPHYDINGKYTAMVDAEVEHFYVKPGDTVANAIAKTVTSNNTDVSFWNEALTTKYTDTLPTTENSVALLPVLDGSGKVRMFKEVPVASGPFEYGMAVMNKVDNTYYSILGFNPLLTADEAKTLYNNKKLALTNTFDKDIWGVKHYAFYTPASEGVEEITYPDIDFDLSTVTNARLYPGMFSFSKTGITKVEFGNKEGYPQYDAFNGCEKLTYADLSGCAGGQARAFKDCVNLSEVKADDMEYWRWGTGNDTFAGCTNLKELTFDIVNTGKKTIDKDLLRGATSLEKIKIKNAAASGDKYLDNSITLYAAAYDTTGKMVGVSVLKEENSGDGFKTLNIPQGNKIKIFQFSKSGNLVPAIAETSIK